MPTEPQDQPGPCDGPPLGIEPEERKAEREAEAVLDRQPNTTGDNRDHDRLAN